MAQIRACAHQSHARYADAVTALNDTLHADVDVFGREAILANAQHHAERLHEALLEYERAENALNRHYDGDGCANLEAVP